jgi:hypothetical protein
MIRTARRGVPTHILAADLSATFFQALLDVLLLVPLVVAHPSDEVVQRFFEPAMTPETTGQTASVQR